MELKKLINSNKYIFFHFIGLFGILFLLHFLQIIQLSNIFQWDAGWYKSIVDNGYVFKENEQSNLAFYPLFPLFWKFLHVSYIGVSIYNLILYLAALVIINTVFKLGYKKTLIFASLPSMFFCFMPYSESLFLFFSTLFLVGYYQKKQWLIIVGLFFASITRSVAPIFLVAIVFVELTSSTFSIRGVLQKIKNIALYVSSVILGICSVAVIQYLYTGKWFYFIEVQKYWGKQVSIPKIPFTTWDSNRLMWLDGISIIIGIISLGFIIHILYTWIRNTFVQNEYSKIFSFSIVYLFLVSLITMLTSVVDGGSNTTSIYSLNRYVLAVPFMFPVIAHVFSNSFTIQNKWWFIAALLVFVGVFLNNHNPLNTFIIVVFFGLTYMLAIKKSVEKYWYVLYSVNVILQIVLIAWFTHGKWIG